MIRAVKGTRDILPPGSSIWHAVEEVAHRVFRAYNYDEIRTPILEEAALFERGIGGDTDVVGKEMYRFEDRDGTALALRPEATASVIRAYIEHRLDQRGGVQKLYYLGPMFRRERPQKGRYRQFYQIGAEAIGSEAPALDAEVIDMGEALLRGAGLEHFELLLNSVGCSVCRPRFVAHLKEALREVAPRMCSDCQRRAETNPLRVLDCKVPEDQPIIETLPSILDFLCEECRTHFGAVRSFLDNAGVRYTVKARLVRGLDYYMRTTFEFVHGGLGAQNTVLGGGRYDGLAEALGSRVKAPGIGFSIGEDRLVITVEQEHPDRGGPRLDLYIAPMGEEAARRCALIARDLRNHGLSVELGVDSKLKRMLELANKLQARFTLIVGDNELASGQYQLKNMASGEQRGVPGEKLLAEISQ